jgi:hypothetical protein
MPLLALVAFPATAAADPEPTIVIKVPVSQTLTSCTGDIVTLTGEQTLGIHISTDNQSGLHVKFSIETRGITGIGFPSGKKYQGLETIEDEAQIPQGATEATFLHNFSLIRQGDVGMILGDDLRLKQISHFTVNAQGMLTADKFELRVDCT